MIRNLIVSGLLSLSFCTCLSAGTLNVTITKLKGAPREGIDVTVRMETRNPDSNARSPFGAPANYISGAGAKAGQVTIPISDVITDYPTKTREVFVNLSSPGLENIQVPYLLGTPATHTITVVMKDAQYGSGIESGLAYRGGCGTFFLAGETGAAMYWHVEDRSRKTSIVGLTFVKEDEQFIYYKERDAERAWAFANSPGRGNCYRVWTRIPGDKKWSVFDQTCRTTSDSQYNVSWEMGAPQAE